MVCFRLPHRCDGVGLCPGELAKYIVGLGKAEQGKETSPSWKGRSSCSLELGLWVCQAWLDAGNALAREHPLDMPQQDGVPGAHCGGVSPAHVCTSTPGKETVS